MAILCSIPGRYGDILWAMAAVRSMAEANPTDPIDLVISQKYGSIAPLLRSQAYLREVYVDEFWQIEESAPMTPRICSETFFEGWMLLEEESYRHVALGYRGWPEHPLPVEVWNTVKAEHPDLPLAPLDLRRPWITVDGPGPPVDLAIGFSDEWFELKVGLVTLVEHVRPSLVLAAHGSRWDRERPKGSYPLIRTTWEEAAAAIRNSDQFLGCCSALHVLAVALGVPAIIVEPNPMRHHPIFWPLGTDGPEVTCVKGIDGQPTFDARHTVDVLRHVLEHR